MVKTSFWKLCRRMLGAALALSAASVAAAAEQTLVIFAHNLGQVNLSNPSEKVAAQIKAMLNDGADGVDFGYFCGPKGLPYFNITDENYTFVAEMCSQAFGGIHVFVFRTGRYELLKRYAAVSVGNGGVDACVVRRNADGQVCALIMPSSISFDDSSESKINGYQGKIGVMRQAVLADYPGALVFTGTTLQWGVKYDALQKYLVGEDRMALTEARVYDDDGTAAAGGIYYVGGPTVKASCANVKVDGIAEPATVARLTYAKGHSVVFKDWDGTVLGSATVVDGGDAVAPEPPAREGYDFIGWSGELENILADSEFVAQYSIKKFEVKFVDHDGAVLKSQMVDWNTAAQAPDDPVRDGYVFIGWVPDEFGAVVSNMTIVAGYVDEDSVFTVRFEYADGTLIDEQRVICGNGAIAPDNPVPPNSGTVFVGWDQSFASVESDLVVHPVFKNAFVEVDSADAFLEQVNHQVPAPVTVRLAGDIDFAQATSQFATVPEFRGILDGAGFSIVNLPAGASLFDVLEGTVRNLRIVGNGQPETIINSGAVLAVCAQGARVESCTVENFNRSYRKTNGGGGAFFYQSETNSVGRATVVSDCVVRDCRVTGDSASYAGQIAGGFAAVASHTSFVRCRNLVSVPSAGEVGDRVSSAGGILARSLGEVECLGCLNEANVFAVDNSGVDSGAGGIVGSVFGACEIYDCTNRAAVAGCYQAGAGGIAGRDCKSRLVIGRSVNIGAVECAYETDGTQPYGIGAGGLLGGVWGTCKVAIFDSANRGQVSTALATRAGGLVGESYAGEMFITHCFTTGAVSSGSCAGGLVGRRYRGSGDIVNCASGGAVSTLDGFAGGLVGLVENYGNNFVRSFVNVYQSGTVTCGDGSAALGVGAIGFDETLSFNNRLVFDNAILGGTAVGSGESAKIGLLMAGWAGVPASPLAIEISGVAICEVTYPPCYDIAGEVCAPTSGEFAEMDALLARRRVGCRYMSGYAAGKGLMEWIVGRNSLELAMHGEPFRSGFSIIVR